jgi:dTDP-4-amino-4,6-dideoxygalactose transaminase
LSDITTYSFFPGKNLGAFGDAGAVSTMRPDLAERVRILRDHGRSEKYRHDVVGYNCRMDTLQAAILNVKLTQLQAWNENRRRMAEIYNTALAKYPGITPLKQDAGGSRSVNHLYVIRCHDRQRIVEHLKANRIGNGIHYPIPVHLQPAYSFLGYAPDDFPVSTRLSKEVLSLPIDGTIMEEEVMRVAKVLGEA